MSKIKYRKGYKYQLVEEYTIFVGIYPAEDIETDFILLSRDGFLTGKVGYAWDGPSGPTWDTPNFMRGSLVHDKLYQLMRLGLILQSYRGLADRLLREICLEDGMSKIRAWYVYRAVRRFAAPFASPDRLRPPQEAP